jgi:hypothetical protein
MRDVEEGDLSADAPLAMRMLRRIEGVAAVLGARGGQVD